jgi:hypothetical protein
MLPLDLGWSRSKVHSLLSWLEFYTNLEEGLRYTAWWAIFAGKGALAKIPEEEPRTTDNAGN